MNLHQRALELANIYKKTEAELIDVLQRIEEKRLYLDHGVTSLFRYANEILKLPRHTSFDLINVARKSREIPELKQAVQAGELTLSNARRVVPVLTKENKSEWLEKAKTLTQEKLEKEVARINPKAEVREKASYVSETRMKLELGISEELLKKLKRIQDLESQRQKKAVSLEDALEAMTEHYLERKDPTLLGVRRVKPDKVALRKQVLRRDQGQCTHVSGQQRCEQKRWIEAHHILPKEYGGKDTLENLTTLCHAHHQTVHRRLLL